MRTFLDNRLKQIREYFGRMAKKDRRRLTVLTVIVIILAIVIVALLSRTTYVTLYTAKDLAETGTITAALREMGEPYRVDGTKVLVAEKNAADLRTTLAAQGTIGSTGITYDMLESAMGFNVTSEQAKKIYEAQAAHEIRVQMLRYDMIQDAVVTIKFGESTPFVIAQGVKDATAAVVLTVRGGAALTPAQANTIAETVQGNIPGIKPENIKISDSNLNYYQYGDSSVDVSTELSNRIALQNYIQQLNQTQAEQILSPVFGVNNIRVTATIRLNIDKVVVEQVEFFPPIPGEEGGIIRSASELYELQKNATAAEGVPGTDSNGMGTVEYPYDTLEEDEIYKKTLLETNYEINETRTLIERAQGTIEYSSISVLVNEGVAMDDYASQIINLLSKGLGISPGNIAVEYVRFADETEGSWKDTLAILQAQQEQDRQRELIQEIIKWAVIFLLGIAVISLIKAIVNAGAEPEPEEPLLVGAGIDYIAGDDLEEEDEYEDVELNKKSTALEQIERFIDKDPSSVSQLLRNWLTDD